MRRAIALALVWALHAPAAAQDEGNEPLPAPWVAHPRPDGFRQLDGLACGDTAIFARSWQGQLARLDDDGYHALPRVPGRNVGRNLWTSADGDVVLTTTEGAIARWQGGEWTTEQAPLGRDYVNQIISFDGRHAYTVGPARIIAFSGDRYAAFEPGTWRDLHAIWGTGDDELWVGGGHGAVMRFDGERMRDHRIDDEGFVEELWGTSARDVWALVDRRDRERPYAVFHWDGESWTDRTGRLAGEQLTRIAGRGERVYVAGAFGVARWDGDDWVDEVRVPTREFAMPRFSGVCLTRARLVLAEMDGPTWVRPLPSEEREP